MSDIKSKFYEFLKSFGKVNTDKVEEDLQEMVKATTNSVTKDTAGNLVYLGKKFPAYNKPRSSWRDGKVGVVLAKKGDEIKVVHFGDSTMRQNYSSEANDAYHARHGTSDDVFSAKYWSNKYLWPHGELKGKGPKPLEELKKCNNLAEIKKSHDFEQRITIEVIAEPWKLDAHNNWYSYDTIVKEAYPSFDKNWKEGNLSMNLFHEIDDPKGELVELVDHYIVPFDCIVPNPATGKDYEIKKGTWCAEVKWNHPALWKQRTEIIQKADGTKGSLIGGLSLNGWGVVVKEEDIKDED